MPGLFSNPVCALLGSVFYHLFIATRCGNLTVYPKQHDKATPGFSGEIIKQTHNFVNGNNKYNLKSAIH